MKESMPHIFQNITRKLQPYITRIQHLNKQLMYLEEEFCAGRSKYDYATALQAFLEMGTDISGIIYVGIHKLHYSEVMDPLIRCIEVYQKSLQNYIMHTQNIDIKLKAYESTMNLQNLCCQCQIEKKKALENQLKRITVIGSTSQQMNFIEKRRKQQNQEKRKFMLKEYGILDDDPMFLQEHEEHIKKLNQILDNKKQVLSKKPHRSTGIFSAVLDVMNKCYSKYEEILTLQSKKIIKEKLKEPDMIDDIIAEFRNAFHSHFDRQFKQKMVKEIHDITSHIGKTDAWTNTYVTATTRQSTDNTNIKQNFNRKMQQKDEIIIRMKSQVLSLTKEREMMRVQLQRQKVQYKKQISQSQNQLHQSNRQLHKISRQQELKQDNLMSSQQQIAFLKNEIQTYNKSMEQKQQLLLQYQNKKFIQPYNFNPTSPAKIKLNKAVNTSRDYKYYSNPYIDDKQPFFYQQQPIIFAKKKTLVRKKTIIMPKLPNDEIQTISLTSKRIKPPNYQHDSSQYSQQNTSNKMSTRQKDETSQNTIRTIHENISSHFPQTENQTNLVDYQKEDKKQAKSKNVSLYDSKSIKGRSVRSSLRKSHSLNYKKSQHCKTQQKSHQKPKGEKIATRDYQFQPPQTSKPLYKEAAKLLKRQKCDLLEKNLNPFTIDDVAQIYLGLSEAHKFETIGYKPRRQPTKNERLIAEHMYEFVETLRQKTSSYYKIIKSFLKFPFQTVAHQIPVVDISGDITKWYLEGWVTRFNCLHKNCKPCNHLKKLLKKLGMDMPTLSCEPKNQR